MDRELPLRRKLYMLHHDYTHLEYAGTDEEYDAESSDLKTKAEAERQQYFIKRYGEDLGSAAARYANLDELNPDQDAIEHEYLASKVEAAMNSGEPTAEHPVIAAIKASELRTDENYISPEH